MRLTREKCQVKPEAETRDGNEKEIVSARMMSAVIMCEQNPSKLARFSLELRIFPFLVRSKALIIIPGGTLTASAKYLSLKPIVALFSCFLN